MPSAKDTDVSFLDYVLPLRLTLVLLLFYGAQGWQLEVPLRVLCGVALLYPPWTTHAGIWLLITLVYVAIHTGNWYFVDNHKYLIGYWCLTSVLALTSSDPVRVLRTNARWIIATCFTFAVAWKLMGGEYLDGSFLHFKFLADRRLEVASSWISSLDRGVLERNRDLLSVLSLHPASGLYVDLATNKALREATYLLSCWTLFIKGLVAVLFLIPSTDRTVAARSIVLLSFVFTTYLFLPVPGFAFALVAISFAQCPAGWNRLKAAHLVGLVVVELTHIPWQILADG